MSDTLVGARYQDDAENNDLVYVLSSSREAFSPFRVEPMIHPGPESLNVFVAFRIAGSPAHVLSMEVTSTGEVVTPGMHSTTESPNPRTAWRS